jgi:SAM-dependent methyltransferase
MSTHTIISLTELLAGHTGGRVLDIATGRGGFACLLHENLAAYQAIVGVDYHRHALLEAYAQCLGPKTHYLQMDVTRLGFPASSFDMACASACLHHLEDAPTALAEARRVLKPGGRFLLVETHSDAEDEPQRCGIMLHHWAADVDAARGVSHRHTLGRAALLEHIARLDLGDFEVFDLAPEPEDPHDAGTIERLSAFIDEHLERAGGTPAYAKLAEQADDLRHRLEETGVRREPVVAFFGTK